MKRTVPLFITAIAGFVLIVSFFIPELKGWGEDAAVWFDILAAIAFVLGGGNLLKLHLKTMSDKKPGWGYSGVTIVAFLVTLLLGLLKVGSPPTGNVEFFGETFVSIPIEAMPVFRVPGSIPDRADHKPVPASVRRQLSEDNGDLVFRGWMNINQKSDLLEYQETLEWQCQVEQLFEASQPAFLANKIKYYSDHGAISLKGVLTQEDEKQLNELLPDSDVKENVISELSQQSQRKTSLTSAEIPESFKIPEDAKGYFSRSNDTLTLTGPMTRKLQNSIYLEWSNFPPSMPWTTDEEQQLLQKLESEGAKLTDAQTVVFQKFFAAEWNADVMIAAINTAGIPEQENKTACQLFKEQQAGISELTVEIQSSDPILLNPDQENAIKDYVNQADRNEEELKSQLSALGNISDAQLSSIDAFLLGLPRKAETLRLLGLDLLKSGPLTSEQQKTLFQPMAEQYAWKTAVGRLFISSHQVKYPWSGDYTAHGNPFWWVYEYVLQPLMTTTFAMLAFYVASAAFRAFRAKNLEATLLLGTAFIVLLGRTYLGVQLTAWMPDALSALKIDQMTVYIMKIFNTAGNRAIMIGIALGIASTSLKVLLGIDRSYLGAGDD